ncbi:MULTISPECIES: hypothetical protein [Sphingomonas]|uniref:hypothetical protein n=1 Tax=Sphingomonas TaxID=13687 RepID=UPI000A6DB005|nr:MULTISPECIES: hypothetical protein [Sphingomonas]MBY0301699.1 hypothetical protein [Sphingomonas ginsenosidimutans]
MILFISASINDEASGTAVISGRLLALIDMDKCSCAIWCTFILARGRLFFIVASCGDRHCQQ